MKKTIILPLLCFGLIACSAEVKSVEYYENNIDEANTVAEKCEATQGSKNDQNCINAKDALYNNYMKSKVGGY